MKYSYIAYPTDDPSRGNIEDVIEAESTEEAANLLRRSGFIAIEIHPVKKYNFDPNDISISRKNVKAVELALTTRQIATMVDSGMSIVQSLDVVIATSNNKFLKESLADVRNSINAGTDLTEALSMHPKIFSPLYISLVRTGEISSQLPQALNRLAEQMEADAALRGEIKSALVYPVIVLILSVIVMLGMMIFIVPTFATIFDDAGADLPSLTKIMVTISDFLRSKYYVLPIVGIGIYLAIRTTLNSEKGRYKWDEWKLKMPMKLGPLYQKIITARYMRTLATLQEAGVSIVESLEITGPTANNVVVNQATGKALEQITAGASIATAIEKMEVFPIMAVAMVKAGETSGELADMVTRIASEYEDQVARAIKTLKSILEPVLMIFIGIIVGIVVISLYLPIFKVYDQIK